MNCCDFFNGLWGEVREEGGRSVAGLLCSVWGGCWGSGCPLGTQCGEKGCGAGWSQRGGGGRWREG